ncbi:MAG: SLC13 family permease [Proteobacteria bacterium]|nr:SLC13 family permease [Pseudomonadota bacterium]
MTLQQTLAFAIIGVTMLLFVWGRYRYDLVAMLSLLVAVALGVVPYDKAFSGFADDIVIIVAAALLVSAAVARSGVIEDAAARIGPHLTTTTLQVVALTGAVAVLSAFVKNIGALAMLMPVAIQLARKSESRPSDLLMPMAFGALLGGVMTLIGTSPNIIVARLRADMSGTPFHMFDFMPVGAVLAALGLVFLAFGWRLLPRDRKGTVSMDAAFNLEGYTTEARVTEDSTIAGKTVGEVEEMVDDAVEIIMLWRGYGRRYAPADSTKLRVGDIVLIEGEPESLERLVSKAKLLLVRDDTDMGEQSSTDEIGVTEAVVGEGSLLVGATASQVRLYERFGVNLLAVSRSGKRFTDRMRSVRLKAGDVIVLRGRTATIPETLSDLRCLPLAERAHRLGRGGRSLLPIAVLALAMGLVASNVVPVAIAFFGAAVLLLLIGALPLRDAYETIEWPILILLACLIPVSDALRTTGATDLVAGLLSTAAAAAPPLVMLALMMMTAMAVTPFLNNAATVLVMGPIAASFARTLGLSPDPFLMAVAVGAACDFLTPIGHQCNTLVMGPGGYRFGDYARLGLPLTILVIVVGVPLIALVWPIRPQ